MNILKDVQIIKKWSISKITDNYNLYSLATKNNS